MHSYCLTLELLFCIIIVTTNSPCMKYPCRKSQMPSGFLVDAERLSQRGAKIPRRGTWDKGLSSY